MSLSISEVFRHFGLKQIKSSYESISQTFLLYLSVFPRIVDAKLGVIARSEMDEAARGSAALASSNFASAVEHYTKAITSNPQAVDYYIKRSTAYTRISPPDHAAAYKDSELALVLASKRAKKELIIQSQLRRGVALFGLERFADAKKVFEWVKELDDKDKTLPIWEHKVEGRLKTLKDEDERKIVSVKQIPDLDLPTASKTSRTLVQNAQQKSAIDSLAKSSSEVSERSEVATPAVTTPASKIRHEWYQTTENVVVTLMVKSVPKEKAMVDIERTFVSISFPLPTGADFQFSLDPLYSEVNESESSFKVMSTKVELTLRKAKPGQKWPTLERTALEESGDLKSHEDTNSSEAVKLATPGARIQQAVPSYPTSSKSGSKDWDKLAADLTKKPKKRPANGKGNEEDDDDLDDLEGGDPVNGFFQQLYKGADPDTKRAMMKSYQESNGTALSTNWAEVKKGKVETSPPEGMEAKPW